MKQIRFLALLLAVCLVATLLTVPAHAAGDPVHSGTCGDSLTWTYDPDSCLLTISGTGPMDDWDFDQEIYQPWRWKYIESIVVKEGVTSIGRHGFAYCRIWSVSLPSTLVSIGDGAFMGCQDLSSITIPSGTTYIGTEAFRGCYFSSIEVAPGNSSFVVVDGILYDKDQTVAIKSVMGQEDSDISLPSTLTAIAPYAFDHCWGPENGEIIIPRGVASIGDYAFSNLYNFTNIVVPGTVVSIGSFAFAWCCCPDPVITLENGIKSIGDYAFYYSSFNTVTIPASVTFIGEQAFSGGSFSSINVASGNTKYASVNGVLFDKNKTTLLTYPAARRDSSYTVPSGVKTIAPLAFYDALLNRVVIPSSVTTIGENAFYNCISLSDISLARGLTTIKASAFSGTRISSISIPSSVTTIGDHALDCSSLTSITVDSANKNYTAVDGVLFNKSKTLLIKYPAAKPGSSYTIPNSVTVISDAAFRYCEELTSISIPRSVTSIGDGAFYHAGLNTPVTIPGSVVTIGEMAFSNTNITGLTIEDGVKTIGDDAFSSCHDLTEVTIPTSVTSLGHAVFTNSSNISALYVSADNPAYCDVDGILFTKDLSTLIYCPREKSLGQYTVPKGVKHIRDDAFYDCESLTSLTLPSGLLSVGFCAFSGCYDLETVTIPDSVTEIGSLNFSYNVTIYGIPGSYAEQYARINSRDFVSLVPQFQVSSAMTGRFLTALYDADGRFMGVYEGSADSDHIVTPEEVPYNDLLAAASAKLFILNPTTYAPKCPPMSPMAS